jgi:hypothetical protein
MEKERIRCHASQPERSFSNFFAARAANLKFETPVGFASRLVANGALMFEETTLENLVSPMSS